MKYKITKVLLILRIIALWLNTEENNDSRNTWTVLRRAIVYAHVYIHNIFNVGQNIILKILTMRP